LFYQPYKYDLVSRQTDTLGIYVKVTRPDYNLAYCYMQWRANDQTDCGLSSEAETTESIE